MYCNMFQMQLYYVCMYEGKAGFFLFNTLLFLPPSSGRLRLGIHLRGSRISTRSPSACTLVCLTGRYCDVRWPDPKARSCASKTTKKIPRTGLSHCVAELRSSSMATRLRNKEWKVPKCRPAAFKHSHCQQALLWLKTDHKMSAVLWRRFVSKKPRRSSWLDPARCTTGG